MQNRIPAKPDDVRAPSLLTVYPQVALQGKFSVDKTTHREARFARMKRARNVGPGVRLFDKGDFCPTSDQ
ncbi:hypothetical protein KC640_02230 [Candidatus Dojkabacteria bacterium]|uniref:Uncharacterized protein n=1 Tax=Candidatus Dojkabacteria bacterium TaxID=2099670 RepID=A0A955I5Y8_9BACT|nr:hypothetical protein [Candidatus Dojkabacteria bacterium]